VKLRKGLHQDHNQAKCASLFSRVDAHTHTSHLYPLHHDKVTASRKSRCCSMYGHAAQSPSALPATDVVLGARANVLSVPSCRSAPGDKRSWGKRCDPASMSPTSLPVRPLE
jgi:hypothetical protein